MENFICNQCGEKLAILNTENIKTCGSKVKADKDATCLHFLPYPLNICRKFEFLVSQGSVATRLWVLLTIHSSFQRQVVRQHTLDVVEYTLCLKKVPTCK